MERLRAAVRAAEGPDGHHRENRMAVDQRAAFDIADLFLNRLLEEDDDEIAYFRLEDEAASWESQLRWVEDLIPELVIEAVSFGGMPEFGHVVEAGDTLFFELNVLLRILHQFMQDGGVEHISSEHLHSICEQWDRYHRRRDDDNDDDDDDLVLTNGPMRPLIFGILGIDIEIMNRNEERLAPSRRVSPHNSPAHSRQSSASSTQERQVNWRDWRWINDYYVGLLEGSIDTLQGQTARRLNPEATRVLSLLSRLRYTLIRLAEPG